MTNKLKRKITLVFLVSILLLSTTTNVFCNTNSTLDKSNFLADYPEAETNPTDMQLNNDFSNDISTVYRPINNNSPSDNRPNFFHNPFENLNPYSKKEIVKISEFCDNCFSLGYNPEGLIKKTENNKIEFVLAFHESAETTILDGFLIQNNVDLIKNLPWINAILINIPAKIALDPASAFKNEILRKSFVKYLEPNYYITSTYIPNDPDYSLQWGPQLIGMETAWDLQLGKEEIRVAIIDSGIDYTHPDLVDNYLAIGYDWINGDPDPMDDHGHGTHCAGIVAASINNGLGIAGIANVSIFAEKFLGSDNYGSYVDAANAIYHAVDMGADILSNSWGGYGESEVLENAINYALENDVIVIAAAMNDATSMKPYPASSSSILHRLRTSRW